MSSPVGVRIQTFPASSPPTTMQGRVEGSASCARLGYELEHAAEVELRTALLSLVGAEAAGESCR